MQVLIAVQKKKKLNNNNLWTDATYARMRLFAVFAYEIRDVINYMCLLDHFNGFKLLWILYKFTAERNTVKCACCFCHLSRYSLPQVNFIFSCRKCSRINLSPSMELHFLMKNRVGFVFFPSSSPGFKFIFSWSTTSFHWVDHCGVPGTSDNSETDCPLQGGLCCL